MSRELARIPVWTLQRYAERFDHPEVSVAEGRARLKLGQARAGGGRAYFVLGAEVAAEGTVPVALPAGASVEDAVSAEGARALVDAGARMVDVFSGLCECARLPADCD